MYQVFINQSSITFQQKSKVDNFFLPYNNLYISDLSQVLSIVDRLKDVHNSEHFILLVADLDLIWNELHATLKVVPAAGGIVENQIGEWLFIFRNGKWDLPKGKVEKDEEIQEAAVREVEEECGLLNARLGQGLPTTYHIYWMNDEVVLKPTYWYKMSGVDGQKLVPQTEEGIEKVEWINPKKLEKVTANTYASIQKLLESLI
ncbi:NUDIX domain-containing protein [Vicingaceae bacterium]|nr:NUDIX domain-containing protein [Vicingaceae bacterium]